MRIEKNTFQKETYVQNRATVILPNIVGKLFQVYNGIR